MSDWRDRQIKDLGEIVTGRTPSTKRKDFYEGEYNLISPADLDNGKYIRTAHKRLTKLGFEQCRALPKDTVLVGCIGNVGKLGMVGNDQSATNQQINALICNVQSDPEFVYYCFHENRDKLEKRAVKTTVPILNKTNFGSFELSVPPLPEQKKIAHILSTIQRAIESQERIIQTTTELKKTLMHKLFTEGLRNEPQKQTEIGPVPESWEVVAFEKFATLQRGKDLTKAQFRDGAIPVAGSNGVIGYHDTWFCESPGVTVGRSGSAGKVTFYEEDFWAHNTSLYVRDFHGNHQHYIAYFLEHIDLSRFKAGVSVPTLDRNSFKTIPVAVPSASEQKEIATALETVDHKEAVTTLKKHALQDLFRTLLHELMTAKTRVADVDLDIIALNNSN